MSRNRFSGTDRVEVESSGGAYPVLIGQGLLADAPSVVGDRAPASRYALISDSRVWDLHGERFQGRLTEAGLQVDAFTFPAGEASKNRKTWSILTDEMLDAGLGRDCAVLALGGGVTGDLAGFVAATYLRGVPVVQFPSSYLAMIDASVGGKTGVDVRAGKNLVGAFHPPRAVVADLELLGTLPVAERKEGLVEAFKHGAIRDAEYYDELAVDADRLLAADPEAAQGAVGRSVRIKAEVVSKDEREGGLRAILNFGHTLGHALEAAAEFQVGHGTAVAAGMLLEAELGERMGVTEAGTRERLEVGLAGLALDFGLLLSMDPDRVIPFLSTDKKAREGAVRTVLLARLGEVDPGIAWCHGVPERLAREVLGTLG